MHQPLAWKRNKDISGHSRYLRGTSLEHPNPPLSLIRSLLWMWCCGSVWRIWGCWEAPPGSTVRVLSLRMRIPVLENKTQNVYCCSIWGLSPTVEPGLKTIPSATPSWLRLVLGVSWEHHCGKQEGSIPTLSSQAGCSEHAAATLSWVLAPIHGLFVNQRLEQTELTALFKKALGEFVRKLKEA